MSQYHRLPAQEPENDQFELDAPTTPSKAPKVATQKRSTDKVVQWITAILLLNVVVLVLNVYLSTGTASRVAMFQEKPLSALPRPDPLYGISRKAPSTSGRLYHPYVDPRDIYNRLPGHFESTAMTLNHTRIQVQGDADTPTWRALAHNGFIRLGEEGLNFDVSMYHQLHCLNQIRTSYNSGVSAFATSVARSESNGSSVIGGRDAAGNRTHVADDDMAVKHSGHCFQYILHALICRADPGLIPISSDEMAKTPDIAEGHTYQCRDWVPVRRTVTENHAKWKGVPYT